MCHWNISEIWEPELNFLSVWLMTSVLLKSWLQSCGDFLWFTFTKLISIQHLAQKLLQTTQSVTRRGLTRNYQSINWWADGQTVHRQLFRQSFSQMSHFSSIKYGSSFSDDRIWCLFLVLYNSKLNILVYFRSDSTKQAIWVWHFGFWEIVKDIFAYFINIIGY